MRSDAMKTHLAELRAELAEIASGVHDLRAALATAQAERNAARKEAEELRATVEDQRSTLLDMEAAIGQAEHERDELRAVVERLERACVTAVGALRLAESGVEVVFDEERAGSLRHILKEAITAARKAGA